MEDKRDFVLFKNKGPIPGERTVQTILPPVPSKSVPAVSVIIPTADGSREGYFPALLKQLLNQSFKDFEIIVIQGDNRQGRAINTGAGLARGKYLLTLDDDTGLLFPDSIRLLFDAMEKDKTIGMAGGINVVPDDAPFLVRRAMQEIPRRSTPKVFEITESDMAEHPFLMMRKDVFVKVGGENERMPRGLDPYLRFKFREVGTRVVVVPKAFYSHLPPAALGRLLRQFFRNGDQSAYCNIHCPQWLYETPDEHVSHVEGRRSLSIRVARHGGNLINKVFKGHFVYVSVYLAYAAGFVTGSVRHRRGPGQGEGRS